MLRTIKYPPGQITRESLWLQIFGPWYTAFTWQIACPRSYYNILWPIFLKLFTNVEDHLISAKYHYQRKRYSNSRVTALDLQILLDRLRVRTSTSISFDQSLLNFLRMLRTIKSWPSSITSGIAFVTQELWPSIYINCLINYWYGLQLLYPLTNLFQTFNKQTMGVEVDFSNDLCYIISFLFQILNVSSSVVWRIWKFNEYMYATVYSGKK